MVQLQQRIQVNRPINNNTSGKHTRVIHCESLARDYFDGDYTLEEDCHAIMSFIIGDEKSDWSLCTDTIPPELSRDFLDFLYIKVESSDDKPDSWIYLFVGDSSAEIEHLKDRMRPEYIKFTALAGKKIGDKLNRQTSLKKSFSIMTICTI